MSILRLAFSLLVIITLSSLVKFRWIPRVFAYLRRNYTKSGLIASFIEDLEGLELKLNKGLRIPSNRADPLPEDLRRRSNKLPELLRR